MSSKVSINYGDLLKRQAKIQRLGKMPAPFICPVRLALRVELGELAQEVKADWAWWKKPGDTVPDRARVLAEAADCLHFMLLLDLAYDDEAAECPDWGDMGMSGWHRMASITEVLNALFEDVEDEENTGMPGWEMVDALCDLLARYDFTPRDLAAAYWAKTEINLVRWREAAR